MDSEMPYFLVWSLSSSAWCIKRYTVYPGLVSCPFYAISIIPFLIYEMFHLLVVVIDCKKLQHYQTQCAMGQG